MQNCYDECFYKMQMEESYNSSKEILAYVSEILPKIRSVLDVGCGVGTWLKAWQDICKDIDIFGIDGNDLDEKFFFIPKTFYKKVDLTNKSQLIFDEVIQEIHTYGGGGNKPFDLVESLEVAEHLEKQYAENFVELLTKFSDIILFSAAIPYQGGTNHFNEQPPQYWAKIFKKFDFVCFDILRTEIWDNQKIACWYRQNTMFYVHKSKAYIFENLGFKPSNPLHLVRPEYLESYVNKCKDYAKGCRYTTLIDMLKFYLRHPKRMFINKA